jgi:SAM-dependent methyltransferase
MAEMPDTSRTRSTWELSAPGWAKWEPVFAEALADSTDAMLDAAAVRAGMSVLDLACGAGSQTMSAARRVGADGEVLATDIAPSMLDYVRHSAAEAGVANVSTQEGAAEELDLPPATFDAAICRLGLMLFAAPARALAIVRQALKPGARFAALVFTTPANNGFLAQSMATLLRHAHAEPPPPGRPGLFALGGDGILAGLLTGCEFADVHTSTVRATIRPGSPDDALRLFQEAAGAYRAVAANLSDDARALAWADVREGLEQFQTSHGFEGELELMIGSGTKPS